MGEERMRELTVKQKQLLDKWFSKEKNNIGIRFDCETSSYFPYVLYSQIKRLNDSEILNQNINNYVSELVSKEMDRTR